MPAPGQAAVEQRVVKETDRSEPHRDGRQRAVSTRRRRNKSPPSERTQSERDQLPRRAVSVARHKSVRPRAVGSPVPRHKLQRHRDTASAKTAAARSQFNLQRFIKRHVRKETWLGKRRIKVDYTVDEVLLVIEKAHAAFASQPVFAELSAKCGGISIIGDIHGQYSDLMRVFNACGWPHQRRFLFLGDYIDRGPNSLECVCLLFAYKAQYPNEVCLLRGNHEWAPVNHVYGFRKELLTRFTLAEANTIWRQFNGAFSEMPLSAAIDGRILCMHGGISEHLTSFDSLRSLQRPISDLGKGLALDLLWSDPDPTGKVAMFGPNVNRHISVYFSEQATLQLCRRLDIDLVVRAHQVVMDGFELHHSSRLVTLFSAPKYNGDFDNAAAVCHVDKELNVSFTTLRPLV